MPGRSARCNQLKLLGRACIITGASRGLGKQLANRFWEAGASLLLVGRDPQSLEKVRDAFASIPPSSQQLCCTMSCDLGSRDAAERIVNEAKKHFERITILVNNAAILGPVGPLWDNAWNDWERTLAVNLLTPARLCALLIPSMKENHYGKIINVSGGGATSPRPNFTAYAVAKTALVRLTETISQELQGTGIDVNSIAPGVLSTDMNHAILSYGPQVAGEMECAAVRSVANGGEERGRRAAELALLLASPESDGITGRLISAVWDDFSKLPTRRDQLGGSDVYTLRRIIPKDRGMNWD